MTIDRDELPHLIAEGVEIAFERLGIDVENRAAMRADFVHLRRWRLWVETMWAWAGKTAVGMVIVSAASAIWMAIKSDFHLR